MPLVPTDSIEGKWYGMTGFPQDRVPIGFEFKRNPQGALKAYIYDPVNNFYGLEIPGDVEKESDTYQLRSYRTSFKFKGDHDHVEGTFFPFHAPLAMARVKRLPSEAPVPALSTGPGPKWRAKLGGGIYAPAAVRDGVAYVGTTSGVFNAIRIRDGSFAWAVPVGRAVYGEALAAEDAVYFVCDDGYLYKLSRSDGKELWRYDLGGERAPRVLMHPTVDEWDYRAPRPVLADGVLFVGSAAGSFHAVRADSGARVWRLEGSSRIRADALVDGPRVIFGNFDGLLYALERDSGHEVWKQDTQAFINASPALVGDKLLVANRGGWVAALNPATGATLWYTLLWGSAAESTAVSYGGYFYIGASDLRRITCYDPRDGRVVWRTDIYGIAWGRPLVTEKTVYASAGGIEPYQMRHVGGLSAIDRTTGRMRWRWQAPHGPDLYESGFVAGPALADETVLVGSVNGVFYAFAAD
jgi:outer membrane protein assembly factor BamB